MKKKVYVSSEATEGTIILRTAIPEEGAVKEKTVTIVRAPIETSSVPEEE